MVWPALAAYGDAGFLFLRLAVGVIFLYHSVSKLKKPVAMAAAMGKPGMAWFVRILGSAEFLGSASIILGMWLQLGALVLALVMVGAIFMKVSAWKVPFSAMDKMGWEFDLVLLSGSVLLLLTGGGSLFQLL